MFCIIVSISATGLFGYLEVDLGVIVGSYWTHILLPCLSQGVLHLQISLSHWLAIGLTTFHNLNGNAPSMWTLGQANWQSRFPSGICWSDAYLGRISIDPPSSLNFHNVNVKWIVVPFHVNDSQLGSDIHFSKLGWNLVISFLNQLFPNLAFTYYLAWNTLEDSEATCL